MRNVLTTLYAGWIKLGHAMGRITNPIVLTILYLVVMLPAALCMKLFGHDPMHRRWDASAASYWIPRNTTHSMKDPF